MDERLKKYCDIGKHFLFKAHSIQDLLNESQNTQIYMMELIELKDEFLRKVNQTENKFEIYFSTKREEQHSYLTKNGIKGSTEKIIDDRVRKFSKDYLQMKEEYDEAKINFDICNTLMMAFFQRKDLIVETINFFKSIKEADSCIVKNAAILKKLGIE